MNTLIKSILQGCLVIALMTVPRASRGADPTTKSLAGKPEWAVGQWWTVESQIYNFGDVVRGARPGWSEAQAWRFEVQSKETRNGELCYVLAIEPEGDNQCPYTFRFWLRTSDLYVLRYELHDPYARGDGTTRKDPSIVSKDFDRDQQAPFFTNSFPGLPMALPIFTSDASMSRSVARRNATTIALGSGTISGGPSTGRYSERESSVTQQSRPIGSSSSAPSSAFGPAEWQRTIARSGEQGSEIILRTGSSLRETQHWLKGKPWCVYGERSTEEGPMRRYWLADSGNGSDVENAE